MLPFRCSRFLYRQNKDAPEGSMTCAMLFFRFCDFRIPSPHRIELTNRMPEVCALDRCKNLALPGSFFQSGVELLPVCELLSPVNAFT